jgi:hypothetical protein
MTIKNKSPKPREEKQIKKQMSRHTPDSKAISKASTKEVINNEVKESVSN